MRRLPQAFAQRLAQDSAHIVIADIAPGSNTVKMVEQAGRQAELTSVPGANGPGPRAGIQVASRTARPVHQAQGRHQQLRIAVYPLPREGGGAARASGLPPRAAL